MINDIYYVLFRHKGKIALISGLGIVAALLLPRVRPAPYQSEAKLYIRYVLETKSPTQGEATDPRVKTPDARGDSIINTELEILTSLDLAQQVADAIGPARILANAGGGANRLEAAALVQQNLLAEVPKNSTVIRLAFQHRDPGLVQPVLTQLIDSYFKKHAEIHAVGAFDDFLTQETDQLRSRLMQTEQELRKAKTNVGVISLEDSKKLDSEQISKIRQAIFDAEAELVERQTAANELAKLLHTKPVAATNEPAATNEVAVPSAKIDEYKRVCRLLDTLERKEQELSLQFTPINPLVKEVRGQMAENERLKQRLEDENPGLLAVKISEPKAAGAEPAAGPRIDLVAEMARATALQSKIKTLTEQLDKIQKEANAVADAEGTITELQRRRDLEDQHYKHFIENLEQSRLDEKLGAGKISNISIIQKPSPPFHAATKLRKLMAQVALGGIAAALALAFFIEFYLSPALKRPAEIEAKLGLPLFISIPLVSQNGKPHPLPAGQKVRLLPQGNGSARAAEQKDATAKHESPGPGPEASATDPESSLTPHAARALSPHALQPFWEGLRDRLITHFEIKHLTHKPKLVTVTSCAEGSGVSTVAAGLAASLSETGDGNVLLVDMNLQGAARQFCKGKLAYGLDDALELEKRKNALIQDNLYLVTEATNGDKLPRAFPRRFTHLVPRLKASDYDYVIFDMPPISQISFTPRLARFMDLVLLVVESEKTDPDVIRRALALIPESESNIGVVFNKRKSYIPRRLLQEL
ncbi:MAG: exopolysaccharide transport family protein [Limisphaerales bacterium]